ncbi:MAG: hypothetical protein ACJ75R_07080, partial [Solirubrobacterales bacterium]
MSQPRHGALGGRLHWRGLRSIDLPIGIALVVSVCAIEAGAIGYVFGQDHAVDGTEAAAIRHQAFATAFEQARRDSFASATQRGKLAGSTAGERAGERAGSRAGARRGAAAVERKQEAIAAAAAAAAAAA